MPDSLLQRIKVHTDNIDRYSRLLATQIGEAEERYIRRRIAEEQRYLLQIRSENLRGSADVKSLLKKTRHASR